MDTQEKRFAGVSPGGIRDPYLVKILICYLLQRLNRPVTEEELIEILTEEGTVNYFLLSATFADLKRLGHLEQQQLGRGYTLTTLGQDTATQLAGELPVTLRERVLQLSGELSTQHRRENETSSAIVETEDGCRLDFSFHDGELEFMKLSLFAPDREQAEQLRASLLRQYQEVYTDLLGKLLADPGK